MSRKRGRPPRQYNLRARTVRRDPIDFEALARAALEQAAMDQDRHAGPKDVRDRQKHASRSHKPSKGAHHDRLA